MSRPDEIPPWADPALIAARRPVAIARRWEPHALCRALTPAEVNERFFPDGKTGTGTQASTQRRTVNEWCAHCPVNTDCVAANVTEQEGVFGSTKAQRVRLRKALDQLGARVTSVRIDTREGVPRSEGAVRRAKYRASG